MISKAFVNLESELVINQKFEKDIPASIYHFKQRVLYELSQLSKKAGNVNYILSPFVSKN